MFSEISSPYSGLLDLLASFLEIFSPSSVSLSENSLGVSLESSFSAGSSVVVLSSSSLSTSLVEDEYSSSSFDDEEYSPMVGSPIIRIQDPLFAQTSFDFDGHTYVSHNHVLKEYEGAEGMKTGYVAAVGYNLITTAKKNDNRLLGVVMGYDSVLGRDEAMKAILDEGFKRVAVQKKAVASGKLSPAMDPLHRRLMLPKLDMAKLVPQMPYHIKAALTMKKVPVYMATGEEKGGPFWTIQVGAFSSIEKAQRMASRALAFLHGQNVKIKTSPAKSLYRAQLTGFSNRQGAVQACRQLNEKECPCFLVHDKV